MGFTVMVTGVGEASGEAGWAGAGRVGVGVTEGVRAAGTVINLVGVEVGVGVEGRGVGEGNGVCR